MIKCSSLVVYLFGKRVCWGKKPIALAVDGWVSTSTNRIHYPVCVIVVYNMEITVPTPEITTQELALLISDANKQKEKKE